MRWRRTIGRSGHDNCVTTRTADNGRRPKGYGGWRRIDRSLFGCGPALLCMLSLVAPAGVVQAAAQDAAARKYTPLVLLPAPRIVASAEDYPGEMFRVAHILDDRELSEYASNGKGTGTFIDMDFGQPVRIGGLRHVDRQDPATIETSEVIFSNQADFGNVLDTETIRHANKPGGVTVAVFPSAPLARYVRWKVTQLNPQGHQCVGGRSLEFFTTGVPDATPRRDAVTVQAIQAIVRTEDGLVQPLRAAVEHPYAEPADVVLKLGDLQPIPMHLAFGSQTANVFLPAVDSEKTIPVEITCDGKTILKQDWNLQPVRHWELHFLPHSHVDIGYTHVQTEVEQKQWSYIRQALQIARNTADYPPAARFKWNCEVMWAVDSYLKQAGEDEKRELIQAVRTGTVHFDGLYGNELTALCRPEELMRLVGAARRISRQYDVTIDSAMISDVPGYTWGCVPALVQSGIKYLSIGPNHVHRIGYTLDQWGDRPFYWVSPSGQERLFCWMAGKAYSWFHGSRVGTLTRESDPGPFFEYLDELIQQAYPYDMVQIRYSIGGDNGPPDQELSEFVKGWNEKYVWPRMVISTTSQLMHAFIDRYGDQVPEFRGDFTPYWEDGAASSARETAMTRMASERLVQAEALWALLSPGAYPVDEFEDAWRDAILYDEHTWGAHCSISEPDSPFTLSQWAIKQSFARGADQKSRSLLQRALGRDDQAVEQIDAIDVFNTSSWPRSDVVILKTDTPLVGHVVRDLEGNLVPSEVTRRGHLALLARDVPPLGAKRYLLEPGEPAAGGRAVAEGNVLRNSQLRVEVDPQTGEISSFRWADLDSDLVDQTGGGWDDYRYVAGRDPQDPQGSRVDRMEVLSTGGLTASLGIYSKAPGCKQLITILRVIDGLERVDIVNLLDKEKVLGKEAVHIGFPFRVPNGVMRINTPWAVIRPDVDQLPGACKNYFTVGRWIDVSNDQFGVTWSTLDAPLVEVGGIHVDVDNPFDSAAWISQLGPTQTLYSYVMNNYWETNYKASQDGMTTFRYSIRPHHEYDQAAAARFAVERSQPLIAAPAARQLPVPASRLRVEGQGVVVTSLKPTDDHQGLMVRLFNAGAAATQASVIWSDPAPRRTTISSPREEIGPDVTGPIALPPLGIITLRAEL